jgi:hypothetical protein
MGPRSVQYVAFVLSLSTASYQYWNKATVTSVVVHVGTQFRSTCVFLYYNQETKNIGKKSVLYLSLPLKLCIGTNKLNYFQGTDY